VEEVYGCNDRHKSQRWSICCTGKEENSQAKAKRGIDGICVRGSNMISPLFNLLVSPLDGDAINQKSPNSLLNQFETHMTAVLLPNEHFPSAGAL